MTNDTLGVDAALAGVSKSVMLARKIKVLGDIKYDPNPTPIYAQGLMTTLHGVVGYDSDMFFKYCHPGSPLYDSLIDFNELAKELFVPNEVWASRDDHLIKAVEDLASFHGFYPKKEKRIISCNRGGKSDETNETSRKFMSGQLAADCEWHLKLKPLSKQQYKSHEAAQKWSYRFLWDSPVQIASCNCDHSGLCNPGGQNRTMVASRAGKYIEKIPDHALYTLCNYLEGHMFRERVYGSLKGWVQPESSNIDKMLGYEPEHINPDQTTVAVAGAISDINKMDASKYSICSGIGPVSALSASSAGITGALSLSSAPPSQLLVSKLNQVTPLNKKEISNIMTGTAAAYNRMSLDQKFRISTLAIELQKLLTVDESQSEHAVSASGYVVDLPTASARISQPHNRLMNAKDHASKRKRANTGLSNSQLQNVGISSTLVMMENHPNYYTVKSAMVTTDTLGTAMFERNSL